MPNNESPDVPRIEVINSLHGFAHRIVCGQVAGDWVVYTAIAQLRVGDVEYRACTEHYFGSLPVDQVFIIKVV